MKRFFRIISILTAAVMLVGLCTVSGVSAANAVEDAEKGVVLVTAGYDTGEYTEIYTDVDDDGTFTKNKEPVTMGGSGFAVGKTGEDPIYIVTNCHVVSDDARNASNSIIVWFSEAANKYMRAEIVAVDTNRDLCILELPESTSERKALSLCKSDDVSKGDEVFTLGYPAYARTGKNYQAFDVDDIVSSKGSISQKTRINNSGAVATNVYLTDATIAPGNSGGPMINSNGEVIGVNTWGTGSNDTTGGYSTMIDELIPLLNSKSIPYTLSTDAASPSNDEASDGEDVPADGGEEVTTDSNETDAVNEVETSTVNDVTETTTAAADTEAAPAAAEPQPASSSNTMVIVIAIVAVVIVIAVVVVIIVVSKNKKQAPAAAPMPQRSSAPAGGRSAVITGMKGIMANRSFNINGSIVIGRNSQKCNVCFPVDAKGISSVHCQIRQANGGYEIMDLGSSNGTFLGSGQKLTPNVPVFIPDGTYFYLGSAEQLFQIKY